MSEPLISASSGSADTSISKTIVFSEFGQSFEAITVS